MILSPPSAAVILSESEESWEVSQVTGMPVNTGREKSVLNDSITSRGSHSERSEESW